MTLFRQLMLKDKKMERKMNANLIVAPNRKILQTCATRSQPYYTKKHTPFVLNIDISLRFTA